jgi:hypothetical protein
MNPYWMKDGPVLEGGGKGKEKGKKKKKSTTHNIVTSQFQISGWTPPFSILVAFPVVEIHSGIGICSREGVLRRAGRVHVDREPLTVAELASPVAVINANTDGTSTCIVVLDFAGHLHIDTSKIGVARLQGGRRGGRANGKIGDDGAEDGGGHGVHICDFSKAVVAMIIGAK